MVDGFSLTSRREGIDESCTGMEGMKNNEVRGYDL
jgi:hypothetical protein